ncbi:aquaporin-like protein [Melanogaster broomeanus]|nr:aquaporin-like protein [Melanogaster broomeanus]
MSRSERKPYWSSQNLFGSIPVDAKAAALEFVGTTFFLLLGLGGIQAASGVELVSGTNLELALYISTCMGFSLLVSAWLFFRVTGGLFNPNITLALFLVGVVGPVRFILFCIAQLLGAIAASAIVYALTPGPLRVNTFLEPGINAAQGVFIEMFITGALITAVLMLAAEKHTVTPFAPVGIGLTLFVGHLFAVAYTGASMNTARAFGPAVVTGFAFPGHSTHWVYWVGPFLGSLLGTATYALFKYMDYQVLTPTQASTRPEDSPQGPAIFAAPQKSAGNSEPASSGPAVYATGNSNRSVV